MNEEWEKYKAEQEHKEWLKLRWFIYGGLIFMGVLYISTRILDVLAARP